MQPFYRIGVMGVRKPPAQVITSSLGLSYLLEGSRSEVRA